MTSRKHIISAPIGLIGLLSAPRFAQGGMPSITFTDVAAMRVETMSFFALGLLLSAAAVMGVWNWLRQDFTALPRVTYAKACAIVALWGILFVVVLTMISGARELMTPGAWKKQGLTYTLDQPTATAADPQRQSAADEQRRQLERLGDLLAAYAAAHDGNYPPGNDATEIPPARWLIPRHGELRFHYVAGLTTSDVDVPLAYVPWEDGSPVPVLLAGGEIVALDFDEIAQRLEARQR